MPHNEGLKSDRTTISDEIPLVRASNQRSRFLGTRPKSRWLRVTTVALRDNAIAAIRISFCRRFFRRGGFSLSSFLRESSASGVKSRISTVWRYLTVV